MILGVQDVRYPVQSLERATSFYQHVLGLRLVERQDAWVAFDVGGVRLGLHATGGPAVPPVERDDSGPRAGAVVSLRVADLFTAVDVLRDQDVRVLGDIAARPWGSEALVEDPDGNVLRLVEISTAPASS